MERHAASAAEELGCRSGAQREANLRVTPSWFISALCVHWCSILCVRLFVQWSLGLNLCASLFSSTLVCWHASTLACIFVWQAHFHIKSVPSAFPSFYFRVQFQILFPQVLSGLVACTASCDVATPTASIVIGLLSGLVVSGLIRVLASHCISLDDYCLMNT